MISWLIDWISVAVVAAVSVTVLCHFVYVVKRRKLNVPFARWPVPLFGNVFRLLTGLEKQSDAYDRIYRQYPDAKVCGFFQTMTPTLMVRDPDLVSRILVSDFQHFTDHGFEIHPDVLLIARSLFFTNGEKWRRMRQKLSPAFTSSKLRDMHDQITVCCDRLTGCLTDGLKRTDVVNVSDVFRDIAIDVFGTCVFGLNLNTMASTAGTDFKMYQKKLFQSSARQHFDLIVILLCPYVAKRLGCQTFPPDAVEFVSSVFSQVVRYRTDNDVVRNDVTRTLLEARTHLVVNSDPADDDKYCDLDINSNAVLMFIAGTETVVITLTVCLYELAMNKDIQDRLRDEIVSTKAKHGGQFTYNSLADLHYTAMVLEETHRKYSISVVLIRETTENYRVPGESLLIEKGQDILIPMYSIHNDPKYYPNPDTFDPDRFTAEQKAKRLAGTYIPFGIGPRYCIGKRFADMELKLILVKLLSTFEVSVCEQTEIPTVIKRGRGLASLENDIWLRFKKLVD